MKKSLIATAVLSVLGAANLAHAADAAPYSVTTNVFLTSDYYFRGITQTWHKPAIQGGADVSFTNGLYAGIWGSNVSNNQYPGGSALEFDYYGGYNGKFNDDWGFTVGGHGYYYPGANFNKAATPGADQKLDSFELNAGLSYKFVSVKYSYFMTDWFGINQNTLGGSMTGSSRGTGYLEANLAYEFSPSWTLNLHIAKTKLKGVGAGLPDPSYKDYLVGVTKTFDGGWSVSAAYVKAVYDNDAAWKPLASLANGDTLSDPGEGKLIVTAGRVF